MTALTGFPGRAPLGQVGRLLTDVCMGRRPADRVIRGGRVVNVHTREIPAADVVIACGRVAYVGDGARVVGPATDVTDAYGAFLVRAWWTPTSTSSPRWSPSRRSRTRRWPRAPRPC